MWSSRVCSTSGSSASAAAPSTMRARPRLWKTSRGGIGSACREDVADVAHGLDDLRLVGVALDLAPQPHDAQVDRAIEDVPAAVVRLLHDLVAIQGPVRMPRKQRQQVELGGGDLDLGA